MRFFLAARRSRLAAIWGVGLAVAGSAAAQQTPPPPPVPPVQNNGGSGAAAPIPPNLPAGQTASENEGLFGLRGDGPFGVPPTAGAWRREPVTVAALAPNTAPLIDGKLSDTCWKTATHAVGFFRFAGSASPVTEQTEAWLCADNKYLYVAFHCRDSRPGLIRQSETQRGGDVRGDDHVGVRIDSQNSRRHDSVFRVSAGGVQNERVEGGTADNISWTGDWKAASAMVSDGWTAEIAIPFVLLRYPKNTKSFGLLLTRHLARETSDECWPFLPPEAVQNETAYYQDFTGLSLPNLTPRPVFLPYVLARGVANSGGGSRSGTTNGGAVSKARQGIDIKYPLSTTLTGVASLLPDFETVEQAVTDIGFSYTERLLPDRRPFFAEGSEYLPGREMFYSRRIEDMDGGLKVVGKQNNLSLGLLGLQSGWGRESAKRQQAVALNARQEMGLYSNIGASYVRHHSGVANTQTNEVGRFDGSWGGRLNKTRTGELSASLMPSLAGGKQQGTRQYVGLNTDGSRGKPGGGAEFTDVPEDFVSDLGYNPNLNQRGYSAYAFQFNEFDKGKIEQYNVFINAQTFIHHAPQTFFRDSKGIEGELNFRTGWGFNVAADQSRRDEFHDQTKDVGVSWNQKTLLAGGGAGITWGRQAGDAYRFFRLGQGFVIARPASLRVDVSRQYLGKSIQTQTIGTLAYRLGNGRTVGGRLVSQSGTDDPQSGNTASRGTNLYFSFGQHVRSGYDLFVLVGDPNSINTRGSATLKIIQPF